MLDSNKTVSSIWVSDELSDMERLSICSFVAHGHDFILYTYGDIANVPQVSGKGGGSVQLRDANEILSDKNIFLSRGIYAHFADWFRWEMIKQKGGWYVDLDVVCLRPLDFTDEVVLSSEREKWASAAVMKFPSGHTFASAMSDACANPNKIQPWDSARRKSRKIGRKLCRLWRNPHIKQKLGESGGPEGVTHAVNYFGMQDVVRPPHVFHPIDCGHWKNSIAENSFADAFGDVIIQHSYTVHFFGSAWTIHNADRNRAFPHNCLYEKLKRQYL